MSHRPLPSVGIPLLRDELRASRVRRTVALAVGAVLAVSGIAAAIFVPDVWSTASATAAPAAAPDPAIVWEDDAGPPAAAAAPAAPALPEAPVVSEEELPGGEGTRTVHRFGGARAFRSALIASQLTGEEADQVISALDDVMDFRRCRPEHELVVERGGDGRLRRFEYRASITQIYEAVPGEAGTLVGRQVEVPVDRVRVRRGGTVRSSLGAALERAGLGRSLVGVFVEVFEREVRFATQTRAGDTFRIIVDEERIGGELLRYGTVHAVEVRGQRIGEHQAFWFEPREDLADFYDESGRAVHGGWLRTPLRYDHISSPFDPRRRHPILRRIMPHNGVDYAAPTGTPVWAAAEGEVTFVGPRGANGNLVSIRHENGYETHYAHLSRFAAGLAQGQRVRQRQPIGYVGSTGRSTGPHLHFGLRRNGRFIDPQAEINGPGRMMPAAYAARYRRAVRALQQELAQIPVAPAPDDGEEDPPEPEAEVATD
ncbi:MAG: M23 family metallopeptidase [Sandaracinaceae bacterium]|nr:M23 family metallopeptidase [Sandaracinaceae bacterium]